MILSRVGYGELAQNTTKITSMKFSVIILVPEQAQATHIVALILVCILRTCRSNKSLDITIFQHDIGNAFSKSDSLTSTQTLDNLVSLCNVTFKGIYDTLAPI